MEGGERCKGSINQIYIETNSSAANYTDSELDVFAFRSLIYIFFFFLGFVEL